ncbi:MAG: DUF5615 family PIN-like protein [Bryobacteraceae bacterium]|jgi:hypothetical protein
MRFLADENFPRPALEALLKAGWDVVSIAEECPGVPDEDVAALCAAQERILLTFDTAPARFGATPLSGPFAPRRAGS